MTNLKVLLILSVIINLSICSLKILKVPKDEEVLEVGGSVNYTVGNYGKIPYGKRLMGNVYLMDPLDGCKDPKLIKF